MKKLKKSFKINNTSMVIPLYNEEVRLHYCFQVIEKFLQKKEQLNALDNVKFNKYYCFLRRKR